MDRYYISPTDGRKSFYKKCYVVEDRGTKTLYSYNTPVIRRNRNGTYTRLWGGYSVTTGRHIFAFCGMSKKEFEAMDVK